MATNGCDVNQLGSDSLLPPRKRLLAGFKKQNYGIISNGSSLPCFPSSSSFTSNSNGSSSSSSSSSSASADVQAHLDALLTTSDDQSRSPEELARSSKAAAALAVKAAKAARAAANEKAIIASKAVAAAKSALEFFASFPADAAVSCNKEKSPRKNKQKKHVPVQLLYTKGVIADEDLSRRLNRAINNSPRVCSGHRNKKQKSLVTTTYESSAVIASTMYDGHDVAGVVDSDSSNDNEVDRVNGKLLLCDKTGEENSSSLGKRRGRVKLKKLPLSMCASKDHESNGVITTNGGVAQPEGGFNGGVAQVRS